MVALRRGPVAWPAAWQQASDLLAPLVALRLVQLGPQLMVRES